MKTTDRGTRADSGNEKDSGERPRLSPRKRRGLRWVWSLGGLTPLELGKRVYNNFDTHEVLGRAAQLSYYFILSLFPLLIFLSSVVGFFFAADRELYQRVLGYAGTVMPGTAYDVVRGVATDVTEGAGRGTLSFGLIFTLWTASLGMEALIRGLNVAYGITEFRAWWRRRLVAMGLTVVVAILAFSPIVLVLWGGPIGRWIADQMNMGDVFQAAWPVIHWTVIISFVLLALNIVYLVAPNLKHQKWVAILPGSFVALAIWLLGSAGFRIYLQYFDEYARTYGSLGAIIVLLMWLYLSAVAFMIGGEVNSEIRKAAAEAGVPEQELPVEAHEP